MQPPSPEVSTCPKCGGVLEETPSGGLGCMSCLLRAGVGSEEETVHDPTPDAHEGGLRFGVYEIDCRDDGRLYELGRGAMGVTYRATDTTLQRKVALKIIQTDIAERSADARERFMREARAAAALRHENIATVYQFGTRLETGQYFYAMELIEGETLDERVRRAGPLDARNIIEIAQQVISALATAEKHGLVHRDLKPANLMLVSPDGETSNNKKLLVKIIDFGLAKAIQTETDPKSLTHDRFVGTPAFASPEQFEHSSLDVRSDIYSLGETLWFALTGKTPFSGRTMEEIRRAQKSNVLPMEQLKAAHVPHRLKSLLESMLALEPASRPSTHELATRLKRCSPEERSVRRTRVAFVTAALLLFGMSALFVFRPSRTPNAVLNAAPDKSIAVLPFENLSADPENAFFTDGVQDEILNNLAKIADLKVISRTSVMQYKTGVKRNVREIANALGVAHVVEGSVQRAANRVRVSAQLIDARTDTHLWVERYDRPLDDVFAIQADIAKAIAGQLQAKLSPTEKTVIEQPPTTNLIAYDFYLRAKKLQEDVYTARLFENVRQQIRLLDQAVAQDPTFMLAYCQLARAQVYLYFLGVDPSPARVALAKKARDAALHLAPDRAEPHLAAAWVAYQGYLDYETARSEVAIARRGLPNDASVFEITAFIARRQGQWEQCTKNLERAVELDPRGVFLLQSVAHTYQFQRRFSEAAAAFDRALEIAPGDPTFRLSRAEVDFESRADVQLMHEVIQSVITEDPNVANVIAEQWLDIALCRRDAVEMASALASLSPEGMQRTNVAVPRSFCEGLVARARGDSTAAAKAFTTARAETERIVREQPDYAKALCVLGMIDAALGHKEDALSEGRRAVELLPVTKDAWTGAQVLTNLAITYAWTGENDLAIKQLEELVRIPSPISYGQLRLHPFWDPLRGDPRFEKLVEEAKLPVALSESEPGSHSGRNFASVPKKSIAVLPFENRSRDPDNAYFAEGVQDEILTRLSKIADLKVISRTSTQHYKSVPENLPEIAKQLGVAHVLEGSVQKSGDTVRVNVQLIKAADDSHLWADTFDRKLTDIFSVESEVAKAIAEQLQAKLSPSESHALSAVQTHDTEAYDLFLRAEYEFHQAESSLAADAFDRAASFYRQALARDPNFAEAAAELARSRLWRHPLAPAELEEVKSLIDRALVLAPSSPEAHLALGSFFYYGHRQYEMALAEFNRTLELQPNNALAQALRAWVYRRRGEWERSLADNQRAEQVDPRNAQIAPHIGATYLALRQWKDAERAELRALAIDPHNTIAALYLLLTRLNSTGDVESARRTLDGFPEATNFIDSFIDRGDVARIINARIYLDVMERRFTDAFQAVEKEVANNDRGYLQQLAGRVALRVLAGQTGGARSAAEQALPLLEARLRERPDDTFVMTGLSWVYLALGRNADALRVSRQAANTISIEKDSFAGPNFQNGLAQIEARAGAPEEAIKRLRRLLSIPAGQVASIARLKIDPVWDPIRDRPDFQQLLSGPEQIGPNK